MTFNKKLTAIALISSLAAGGAFAKGHAQGGADTPGADVSGTVSGAQGLGAEMGGKGPAENPGKSGMGGSGKTSGGENDE